jgi:hypothetical protein
MVEKIQLIQNRIKELEEMLEKARSGRSYADLKWTESLLNLNKKILTQLMHGLPIEFYKVQYTDEKAKGFFLTKDQVIEPFVSVWN